MPRDPVSAVRARAREQFSDQVSDSFARLQKDQRVFYVGSVDGNSAFSGRRVTNQKATISQAVALCTASRGDTVLVSPFHTETLTAVQSISTIGTIIRGLSVGNQYPVFTINGAVDLFSLDAAGCELSNVQLAIVTTDAATAFVNVTAAKCKIKNVKMIPSSGTENVVDCITLASGANDVLIDGTFIFNTTVAVNSFLSIEAAVARAVIINNRWFGDVATAGIIDGAAATQMILENNTIGTIGTTIPATILDSNPTGIVDNNRFLGTHTTIASNAQLGNVMRQARSYVLEATDNSVQATNIIPALDTE